MLILLGRDSIHFSLKKVFYKNNEKNWNGLKVKPNNAPKSYTFRQPIEVHYPTVHGSNNSQQLNMLSLFLNVFLQHYSLGNQLQTVSLQLSIKPKLRTLN